ncbi:MAG: hypothetical protein ACK4UU_09815, partial [Fimbriimonadales bacterium]
MGVFRLYAEILQHLAAHPRNLSSQSLDSIASVYSPYAYIGNRKSLKEIVIREAKRLSSCFAETSVQEAEKLATRWFGSERWQTDSGAFPDFVLAWQGTDTVGDGALLELKDSKSSAIASFNSTLPTARKALSQ